MKSEIWNRWIPDKNLSKKYYIDEVSYKDDDLTVYLSDDCGQRIVVVWDCIIESYTCTEETNRTKRYNDETSQWTFFEIYDSKYICWLIEESCNILSARGLHHICIIGDNLVIDVVASEYPKIIYG